MHRNPRLDTLGVFKPAGPLVMAFVNPVDREAAAQALHEQGFDAAAVWACSAADMKAQIEARLRRPRRQDERLQSCRDEGRLDPELKLLEAHRVLAESGCSFLIVHAGALPRAPRRGRAVHAMKSSIGAALWPARRRAAPSARPGPG